MPDVQCADSFRGIQLMSCDGQQVNTQLIHTSGNLAYGLRSITMHQYTMAMGSLRYFSEGLQRSSFIVRVHDGDQDCLMVNCPFYCLEIDTSIRIHRQICDTEPMQSFKSAAGVEHSGMFCDLRDNMVAKMATIQSNSSN